MRKMIAIILTLLSVPVAAQESQSGRILAERWCMACHIVEREPRSATADRVPTFRAIAASREDGGVPRKLPFHGDTRLPDFHSTRAERTRWGPKFLVCESWNGPQMAPNG